MKGLALCGGGAKGSYELGAIEALEELKQEFDIVTGTSIGALNASMYVQGDVDKLRQLWETISINKVLDHEHDIESLKIVDIIKNKDLRPFLKKYITKHGSQANPFKELVYQNTIPKKISDSKIKLGVVVSTFPIVKIKEVYLNELSEELIIQYLIASASCFPLFPIHHINKVSYIDGGYTDNLPINLAFKLGAKEIIAIDLNHKITHKNFVNKPFIDYIYPKVDLGSFMSFNKVAIKRNRMLGYLDVLKYYKKYDGFIYTFHKVASNKLASELALCILNDCVFLKESNKEHKNLPKKDITVLLNEHIFRKVTDIDYLIKSIEYTALLLDVSFTKIYKIVELKNIILNILSESATSNFQQLFFKEHHNKRISFLKQFDKKLVLKSFFEDSYDFNFKITLLNNLPKYYLAYIFIQELKNDI